MSHKRLILIDSHALIYRAFFAFPHLTAPDGRLVNAVYGFTRILLTVIRDLDPDYIAAAMDLPKPTFRHTEFVGYKAQRKEMPEELQGQIQLVKDIITVLNLPLLAVEGYEADDVIGTIATHTQMHSDDVDVLIVTGDKDSFQLVTDRVHVYVPGNGKIGDVEYGPEQVERKMELRPDQIVDFKALAGDPSDNIPGVKGVGGKTAIALLKEFTSLENLYAQISSGSEQARNAKVLKPGVLKKLSEDQEMALLSQKLATIDRNVPISVSLEDCRVSGYDKTSAVELFEELGFKSLIKNLPSDDFELDVEGALL